ncbi:MAG: histidine kinase [Elusimicrobia bacterium RIFCSPHIGHO2_02_FULL_61_10]|nr:MAG: histidine kinase [Elusimicrobia bacterium RIFCSPHIGHO2_02_FULL_61_10]
MISLKQFLEHKGGEIWSVTSESSVLGALQKMAEKNIGALLVIDEGKLVGILSERDYARKVALMGKVSKDTAVKEIMTQRVLYVRPDESIEDCMALMTEKHFRHLPVIDNKGKILGMISIGDVVRIVISKQKFIIAQLENYISGGR